MNAANGPDDASGASEASGSGVTGATSPAADGAQFPEPWPPQRPSRRGKLRNGTFIVPSTGERSRRQFTLRHTPLPATTQAVPSMPWQSPNAADMAAALDEGEAFPSSSSSSSSSGFLASVLSLGGFCACLQVLWRAAGGGLGRFGRWMDSPKGRSVLKCTVAYTIASLWTFFPPLSRLLGHLDGKHMVATITVYFHPARSAGSMIEASAIGVVAVAYGVLVSVLSMAVSVLFGSVLGWATMAYVLVLVLFVGGGLGVVGWVKQRLNNPSVNVGGTLASLAIITVVTKENATYTSVFSNRKIAQVLQMLVFGICITSAVSLLLWRVSARAALRTSLCAASAALGDMMAMITHGFLSGAEDELTVSAEFRAAAAAWTAAHAETTRNLREAKYEHYAVGHANVYRLEKAVHQSLEALAQSIGGLRSAANTQFELLREAAAAAATGTAGRPGQRAQPPQQPLSAIDEASDESSAEERGQAKRPKRDEDTAAKGGTTTWSGEPQSLVQSPLLASPGLLNEFPGLASSPGLGGPALSPASSRRGSTSSTLRTPSEIFELFIGMLGPSMKSLAFTLASILREPPFGPAPAHAVRVNDRYRQSLTDALALFNEARAEALSELYRTIELGRPRSEKIKADFEEVAAACGHFSFSLQAFGEEMGKYLDVLDDLKLVSDCRGRSWRWLLFWKTSSLRLPSSALPFGTEDTDVDEEARAAGAAAAAATAAETPVVRPIRKSQLPRGIPDTMVQRRDTFSWHAAPQANALVRRAAQVLLRFFRVLTRDDIRFGIKVGIGAMLWAMLAFISQTRATYMHWRGEWGLLSFMIVCSMTVGASNTTGMARFLSTLTGACCAVVNWDLSRGHALPLMLLGWLVSLASFYVMIDRGRAPLGRTTLLAYNVITLYAYSLSQQEVDDDDDDEGGLHPLIMEIARHRFLAVTAGICWGLLVCRVIWPISARRRFKEGLSMLYLQMGLIWRRGPLAMLLEADGGGDTAAATSAGATSTQGGVTSTQGGSYLRAGEQAALQRYATRLETLRASAASEFELRGPFPTAAYGRITAATMRALDGFYAMSLLTQRRHSRLTPGERALLRYTAPERAMLCDRICHVFQVLASSLMLEYPLTAALPGVAIVRDRLLAKIFQFRKEHAGVVAAAAAAGAGEIAVVPVEERDYALLYAYALITGQVADELKIVEREIEGLFGVLDNGAMLLQ